MNERFILIGFLLFVVVILPILLVRDFRHKKKIRNILESYRKEGEPEKPESGEVPQGSEEGSEAKGWGMNNSPFRERKSGLSWGGGNIKASEASRGSRRKWKK